MPRLLMCIKVLAEIPHSSQPHSPATFAESRRAPTATERYRCCFKASPDGILLVDPQRQTALDCNPALERLSGDPRRQIVEQPLGQLNFLVEAISWLEELMASRPLTDSSRSRRHLRLLHRNGHWLAGWGSAHTFVANDSLILQFTFTPDGSGLPEDRASSATLAYPAVAMEGVISSLRAIMGARDPYTQGHQARVAALSRSIATSMGLDAERIEGLYVAALLHDIGKVSIGMELLTKPIALKPEEFQLIKTHVQTSYEVLRPIDFPWPVATIVHQHHERLDGSGYPLGLRGDQLLLEAQILAVADTVESMTMDRPYRRGKGIAAALELIESQRGSQFAPEVVDACLRLFREQNYLLPST
ncbi:MAG: HD domain-containing phosphohydrolase [Synechococcaceae cyanobacterium]